jgi:hypothetical protein
VKGRVHQSESFSGEEMRIHAEFARSFSDDPEFDDDDFGHDERSDDVVPVLVPGMSTKGAGERLLDYTYGERNGVARFTYLRPDKSKRLVDLARPRNPSHVGWDLRETQDHDTLLASYFANLDRMNELAAAGAYR